MLIGSFSLSLTSTYSPLPLHTHIPPPPPPQPHTHTHMQTSPHSPRREWAGGWGMMLTVKEFREMKIKDDKINKLRCENAVVLTEKSESSLQKLISKFTKPITAKENS